MGEMLNDLIFSVNTILPVFIVVAIGYFMRWRFRRFYFQCCVLLCTSGPDVSGRGWK